MCLQGGPSKLRLCLQPLKAEFSSTHGILLLDSRVPIPQTTSMRPNSLIDHVTLSFPQGRAFNTDDLVVWDEREKVLVFGPEMEAKHAGEWLP